MIETVGDYWVAWKKEWIPAIVCTTNMVVKPDGNLVMGAGIAKAFKEKFPEIDRIWGNRVKRGCKNLMITDYWDYDDKQILVALPTKYHWKDPSPMELVVKSCQELKIAADFHDWWRVLMTRPGCGNGGLKWEDVKKEISFLDERFKVINNETT